MERRTIMPQVPYSATPSVAPNQPQEYQRVQATPSEFGSTVGQATQQLGENISNLGKEMWASQMRVQSREDAIERARDYGTFEEETQKKLISLANEGDLSRQETVNGYRDFIDETKNRIISEHRGSQESQMQLMAKLEENRSRVLGNAAAMSVQAQRSEERRVGKEC